MDLSVNTKEHALRYEKYSVILEGYSNTNWITDSEESKSTSGYIFTLGGTTISSKSSKQTCTASSTMELKFVTLDKAEKEAEWLRQFWRMYFYGRPLMRDIAMLG